MHICPKCEENLHSVNLQEVFETPKGKYDGTDAKLFGGLSSNEGFFCSCGEFDIFFGMNGVTAPQPLSWTSSSREGVQKVFAWRIS